MIQLYTKEREDFIMEQITEVLVQKEPDKIDVLKKTGIVVAAFIVAVFSMMLAASIEILNSFGLFFAAVVIFVAYKFAQTTDVEYEYCAIDGDIDVDKIFAKKRRKKYVSVTADRIEKIIPAESEELKTRTDIKKTYFAARSKKDDTNYVVIFKDKAGMSKLVIVDDEKLMLQLLMAMPRKVTKRV